MLGRCRASHVSALKIAMLQLVFAPCRYIGGLSKKVRPLMQQKLTQACLVPQLISMGFMQIHSLNELEAFNPHNWEPGMGEPYIEVFNMTLDHALQSQLA